MVAKGLSLVVSLLASLLTPLAARGPTSGVRSVGFQGSVSRNSSGHWVVQLALLHGGQRGPRDHYKTLEWGTYDVTIRSLLRKIEPVLETTVTITVPPVIPSDYEFYDGIGYYKIHLKKTTWKVANETCYEEGAYLALINSKQEEEVIKGIVQKSITGYVFIGLHREEGKEYQTVLGYPFSSLQYANWNGGNLTFDSGHNCGVVNKEGRLLNAICSYEYVFICELPI